MSAADPCYLEWKEARENTANLGGFSSEAVGSFFEYLYTGDTEINGSYK